MLILITPQNYILHREDLDTIYCLRAQNEHTKQDRELNIQDSRIKDNFDEKNAYYLVYKDEKNNIRGCLRFVEMIHECMLDYINHPTLPNIHEFKRPNYWEVIQLIFEDEQHTHDFNHISKEIDISLLVGYILFSLEFENECSLLIAPPISH